MCPKAHLTKGTLSNCATYRKTHIIL
jgi:hypothetical protein